MDGPLLMRTAFLLAAAYPIILYFLSKVMKRFSASPLPLFYSAFFILLTFLIVGILTMHFIRTTLCSR